MSLTDALEKAWTALSNSVSTSKHRNLSVIAFQFCESIRLEMPSVRVIFDNRDIPADPYRPNLVIYSDEKEPEILFIGKLIIDSSSEFSAQKESNQLLKAIEQKQFNVLDRDNGTGEYCTTSMQIADYYRFGLFIVSDDGMTNNYWESTVNELTESQLNRFIFAQSSTELSESNERSSCFRKIKVPSLSFRTDSRRTLYVDYLTVETELSERSVDEKIGEDSPLLLKRRIWDSQFEQWFKSDEIHFVLPENFTDSEEFEGGALVSVVLFSKPINDGFGFSELMVVLYVNLDHDLNIKEMLSNALHDLDWESLAIDRVGVIDKLP